MAITDTERFDYLINLISKGGVEIKRNGLLNNNYSIITEKNNLSMPTNNVRYLIDTAIEHNNL